MLRNEGWKVNHKKVERIWRSKGLRCRRGNPKEAGYG